MKMVGTHSFTALIILAIVILSCSLKKTQELPKELITPEPITETAEITQVPKPVKTLTLGIIETSLNEDTINLDDPFNARICFDYNERDRWTINESDSLQGLAMNICFDGRTIGNILLDRKWPNDFSYSNQKKFFIQNVQQVPRIGKPSWTFAGWPNRMIYRPLVINTQPYYTDQKKWKPFVPGVSDSTKIVNWINEQYFQTDSVIIQNILKSYKTADSKRKIIKAHLNEGFSILVPYKDQFHIYEEDTVTTRYSVSFLIKDDNEVTQLAPYLTLIDAGDYNNNGEVELIFKIQTYNYDGYVLYYNDFNDKIHYGWRYH